MDLTFLELHLHDAEFNAPFAGRSSATGDEPATADEEPTGEPTVRLGPIAALLAFVGLALLARYLRGGESEQATLDEVEA